MKPKNETILLIKLKKLLDKVCDPIFSTEQKDQLALFLTNVLLANQVHNLTAITDPEKVIAHHVLDSLAIMPFIDFASVRGIVDIGTGAGFPGIPLKIMYPDIPLVLIEVNKKKITFLESVVAKLSLKDIVIYPQDWRTFLRKTNFSVDVFLSRASLHPEELLRMFRPSSPYRKAKLVYFASQNWRPLEAESIYLYDKKTYTIENRKRFFVFFCSPDHVFDLKHEDLL